MQVFEYFSVIHRKSIKKSVFVMRKNLATICLGLIVIVGFSGCDKPENPVNPGIIVDFSPVNFNIQIRNTEGVDMLDSTKHETFLKDISVRYEGHTYRIGLLTRSTFTRYYMPEFKGLQLQKYYSYKKSSKLDSWCLVFGDLDGGKSCNYDLILQIGNKSIPLTISSSISKDSKGYPKIDRKYYACGEMMTDESGKRGCYHFLYTSTGDLEYIPSEYE